MIDKYLRNYADELLGYNEFSHDFGERRGLGREIGFGEAILPERILSNFEVRCRWAILSHFVSYKVRVKNKTRMRNF